MKGGVIGRRAKKEEGEPVAKDGLLKKTVRWEAI